MLASAIRPTTNALVDGLSDSEQAVASFFASLSPDELVTRVGDAWSPAEHLMHLNTVASAAARGFGLSPLLLRLRFGKARKPSRDYETLRADYRAVLAEGAGAPARFAPPRDEVTRPAQHQLDLLERWGRVNGRLREALSSWTERRLDTLRLPHPLLGKITAREMALFLTYHNHHHIEAAKRRLARFANNPKQD